MDRLAKILNSLSHLNLEGSVVDKQEHASGLGGSCDVYSAWSVRHNRRIAVKQIRAFLRKDTTLAKKLAKEIRIWANLNHANVLPLLGYFTEGEDAMPSMVSEWMEKGTLHEFMKTFPRGGIQACFVIRDVAAGLAYLHSKEVIHADLKAQNILIARDETPKLADFGLSLALSQSQSTMGTTATTTKGTVRWMAIELLPSVSGEEPSMHNKMSDIWALGMVIYELLSWDVPYKTKHNDILVLMAIVSGQLPEKPERGHDRRIFSRLWKLCESCWQAQSTSRPTAAHIVEKISKDVGNLENRSTVGAVDAADLREQLHQMRLEDGTFFQANALHRSTSGRSFQPHICSVVLTDRELIFDCERDKTLGSIQSVALNYISQSSGESHDRIPPFEFAIVNCRANGASGMVLREFSVSNTNEAKEWVLKFEKTSHMSVAMSNATEDNILGLVKRLVEAERGDARQHQHRRHHSQTQKRRVQFLQDVTGEGPTVIPLPRWFRTDLDYRNAGVTEANAAWLSAINSNFHS